MTSVPSMTPERAADLVAVEQIANALLYEGYLLYPYRLSALKNRHRWTFGCLLPPDYCPAGERSQLQTEFLLQGSQETTLLVKCRFLQLKERANGIAPDEDSKCPNGSESEEREVYLELCLSEIVGTEQRRLFAFPTSQGVLEGATTVLAEQKAEGLFKLTARVENLTHVFGRDSQNRDAALLWSLVSCHLIVGIQNGSFLSQTDPPGFAQEASAQCRNEGVWPVLAGDPARRNWMIAAPIILYDFPQVASQSPGDLFDGTEIDELLTLRILTLTDAEQQEMQTADIKARTLLKRSRALSPEQLLGLHGTLFSPDDGISRKGNTEDERFPITTIQVCGREFKVGDSVRLCPRAGGDVMDLALAGKIAVITAIEQDFEDRIYFGVVVNEDPGKDYGIAGRPGHRFFFGPEEVELLTEP